MTVRIRNQEVTAVVTNAESAIPKIDTFPGFQALFSKRRLLLVLGDALIVILAAFGAFMLWHQTANAGSDFATHIGDYWYWFPLLLSGWWVLAWFFDLYDISAAFDKTTSTKRVAAVGVMNLVIFLIIFFVTNNLYPSFFLYFLVIVWPVITLWRIVYATVLTQPKFQRRALILGTGLTARTIAQVIKERDPGYKVIGYVASDVSEQEQSIEGVSVLGKWASLTGFVQDYGVSDIILATIRDMPADQLRTVLKCFEQGVRIVPMPKLFEEITGCIPVEHIGERWLAALPIDRDSRALYPIVKRVMDIVLAGIGLLLLAPVFPLVALAIKLDSPGPIFYRPLRLGRAGKPFHVWKFRTMVVNADRIGDPTFTTKNDKRITRVGSFLRTTHIDELPQFINIIAGDMSIVGPRPERSVPELEESIPYYRTRYAVKPGATGWALVKQGYAEGFEDTLIKLQYDLYYIKHQSFSFDLIIICKSVIHMLTMGGR